VFLDNLLMLGPPGAGTTMLARLLRTILPPLDFQEASAATSVHSVAGLLSADKALSPSALRAGVRLGSESSRSGLQGPDCALEDSACAVEHAGVARSCRDAPDTIAATRVE
jgi:predicted ATPase with chaperone activity